MTKRVLITGATSGIGEACAHIFAREKYDLVLAGRREERLKALASALKNVYGVNTQIITLDVRNKDEVEQKLESLTAEWKKIDVLINNAGLSLGLDPIQNGSTEDWDNMLDTNVKGLLYVTKVVSNWMIPLQQGHIINIGSIAGKEVYANGNVYCATKSAVDALNKAMRIDLLPYNIRVTAVHPGAVETEFSEVRFKGDKDRAKKVYDGFEPLIANDIAEIIWFAASRPAHVNISDLLVMPAAQADTKHLKRS
jgi:NADP-dependent 3-hydroxy acid dehydrogenase YdfG